MSIRHNRMVSFVQKNLKKVLKEKFICVMADTPLATKSILIFILPCHAERHIQEKMYSPDLHGWWLKMSRSHLPFLLPISR